MMPRNNAALPAPLRVPAVWTDDCQGKKNFDGHLVSLATRYWPSGYQANGKVSANAAIVLHVGDETMSQMADRTLAEQEFEAVTEAEVKAQVEVWAQDQYERMAAALTDLFSRGA